MSSSISPEMPTRKCSECNAILGPGNMNIVSHDVYMCNECEEKKVDEAWERDAKEYMKNE